MELTPLHGNSAVVGVDGGDPGILTSECHRYSATVYLSTHRREPDPIALAAGAEAPMGLGDSGEVDQELPAPPMSPWVEAVMVAMDRVGLQEGEYDPMARSTRSQVGEFLVELWDWANVYRPNHAVDTLGMTFHNQELPNGAPPAGLVVFFGAHGARMHLRETNGGYASHTCTSLGFVDRGTVGDRLRAAGNGAPDWLLVDPHSYR